MSEPDEPNLQNQASGLIDTGVEHLDRAHTSFSEVAGGLAEMNLQDVTELATKLGALLGAKIEAVEMLNTAASVGEDECGQALVAFRDGLGSSEQETAKDALGNAKNAETTGDRLVQRTHNIVGLLRGLQGQLEDFKTKSLLTEHDMSLVSKQAGTATRLVEDARSNAITYDITSLGA